MHTEDHEHRMHERITAMVYGAIRAYFRLPSGAPGHQGFLPWEALGHRNQEQLTEMVNIRLSALCMGRRLPSLEQRARNEEFNLGLAAYLMDTMVTAIYDYTVQHANALSDECQTVGDLVTTLQREGENASSTGGAECQHQS